MIMLESPATSHLAETLKLLGNGNLKNDNADIQEFRNRIQTFILDQKWVGKPFALSPPICSRFGWKCCGPNKLQCVSCSAILCTSLPEMEKCSSYDKCVIEVVNSLKSAHRKHCPWPLAPCPENFFQMVPVCKEAAFEDFVSRLESLLPIETFLPEVKDTVFEALALSHEDFEALCNLSHISDSPFRKSAILLAATGWRKMPDAGKKKYIMCVHCQRTVGVWLYSSVQSKSSEECTPEEEKTSELQSSLQVSSHLPQENTALSPNTNSIDEPSDKNASVSRAARKCEEVFVCKQERIDVSESLNHQNEKRQRSHDSSSVSEDQTCAKRRKLCLKTNEPFDPLYEHRPWCMWTSKTSTGDSAHSSNDSNVQSSGSNSEVVPGYKVYAECLLKNIINSSPSESSSISSPTKEQLNKARELLMTWSSPV